MSMNHEEQFIAIRTPLSDLSNWRSDGTITSSDDLQGHVAIIWSTMFVNNAIPGDGLASVPSISLAYPPVGIRCFGSHNGLTLEHVGEENFVAVLDMDNWQGKPTELGLSLGAALQTSAE
jgi:hypothetical protein